MKTKLWFVIPLAALYLALTENIAWNNIIVALVLALLVVWLVQPPAIALNLRRLPTAVLAAAQYIIILLIDLFLSGIQVARLLISPKLTLNTGIIPIQSQPDNNTATALSTHAITLTPGEMVLENDEDGVMYTHSLSALEAKAEAVEAEAKRQNLLGKITAVANQSTNQQTNKPTN